MTASRPDLNNLQANIVYGSGHWRHACYVFLRIEHSDGARKLIRKLMDLPELRDAEHQRLHKSVANINIAFTHDALVKMDATLNDTKRFKGRHTLREIEDPTDEPEIPSWSAFEAGMFSAKKDLGDVWPRNQAWWSDDPDIPREVDNWPNVLVWISAMTPVVRRDVCAEVQKIVKASDGVTEVGRQHADAFNEAGDPDGLAREHFGFMDGISQPAIEGLRAGNPGDGKLGARGWRGLKVGEFFLGYEDEAFRPADKYELPEWTRDGTFLVYRKLRQDVGAFRRAAEDMASSWRSADDIEEAMMGRKKDGNPLLVPPGAPTEPEEDRLKNDFTYERDRRGLKCPLGSHIRRSNPRDDLHFEGRRVNSHRIIRRGMTYGKPYREGEEDEAKDRGLIFIAFNARIEDQFEFIQKQWLNRGTTFRIGDDADPIAGVGEDIRIVINGEQPVLHQVKQPFTKFMGGDYFFVPSISGLKHISSDPATAPSD